MSGRTQLASILPASPPPVLTIRDLGFQAPALKKRATGQTILQNLNLNVREQEFVSIVGPSGCGKSTLLNFIAGLLPVQQGEIHLAEKQPGEVYSLGYMFQQHGLLPWRRVRDNVGLGLEIQGVAKCDIAERSQRVLDDLGLTGYEQHYPAQLSGGMCQRVALARMLVSSPDILLMDEPFGALDAQTRVFIQELFSHYWETHKKTVLFVTHDLAEALFLSDRIVVMGARPGRIVAEYDITFPRPRHFDTLRTSSRFGALLNQLWQDIKSHTVTGGQRDA